MNIQQTFGFTTKANGIAREMSNEIFVGEYYDASSGLPEPEKRAYKAVWDTGCTNTAITRKVVQDLGLQPSGRASCQVAGAADKQTTHDTDTFLVNVYLPNGVVLAGLRVSEMSMGSEDVLLGMDVIAHGDFAVTNYAGKTWWTFRAPSIQAIDFVEEIRKQNERHSANPPANAEFRQWLAKDKKKQGMRKMK